jgi:aspartyl-tRNA(Asn)/glutamyl-tRNA(Gln) amidotransferase subunit C
VAAAGVVRATRLARMSTISRDEVARVAALARIDLRPDELDRLAGELDVIVESIAQVSAVATPDVPATSHPLPMSNVFRADVPVPPLPVEDALAAAPDAQDGRFAVPQILGEE